MNIVIVQNNDPMTHTARKRKREEKRRKLGLSHGISHNTNSTVFSVLKF